MTEPIKDANGSIQNTPFPYQSRGGNAIIISQFPELYNLKIRKALFNNHTPFFYLQ